MTARLLINCSQEEALEFLALAKRCKVSPSVLGGLAVRQMLMADKAGARPMIAPETKPIQGIRTLGEQNFSQDWMDSV